MADETAAFPRNSNAMMRIGIISDTHGLLRAEAKKYLAGVDHIVHAGDIGALEVIEELRKIAPTTAIRGNIDTGAWATGYANTKFISLGGRAIYVLHNLKEIKLDPATSGIDIVVSGHSHRPNIGTKNGNVTLAIADAICMMAGVRHDVRRLLRRRALYRT